MYVVHMGPEMIPVDRAYQLRHGKVAAVVPVSIQAIISRFGSNV
jgi:hypothetical protein